MRRRRSWRWWGWGGYEEEKQAGSDFLFKISETCVYKWTNCTIQGINQAKKFKNKFFPTPLDFPCLFPTLSSSSDLRDVWITSCWRGLEVLTRPPSASIIHHQPPQLQLAVSGAMECIHFLRCPCFLSPYQVEKKVPVFKTKWHLIGANGIKPEVPLTYSWWYINHIRSGDISGWSQTCFYSPCVPWIHYTRALLTPPLWHIIAPTSYFLFPLLASWSPLILIILKMQTHLTHTLPPGTT